MTCGIKNVSILNHVLGPVMRGPSSSHTAGGFHLANMARTLLGSVPRRAILRFDPHGSYAQTYAAQGADRAIAMGFLNQPLTDGAFFDALETARESGLDLTFEVQPIENPDHPNTVEMVLTDDRNCTLRLVGRSIGGGEVEITRIDDTPVLLNGSAYEVLVETATGAGGQIAQQLNNDQAAIGDATVSRSARGESIFLRRSRPLAIEARHAITQTFPSSRLLESQPVYLVATGQPQFCDAAGILRRSQTSHRSVGQIALDYEATLLGLPPGQVVEEIMRRYDVMCASIAEGMAPRFSGLQLLQPSAGAIALAESRGRLSAPSHHTRAAARAMAVMHVDAAMGVVCAAPTGGSAGVIPAALMTLAEERQLPQKQIAEALLAAGAIGVVVARRATFAAEVAGCQVEIGAAGAMAAAAIVDAVGGSPLQSLDAAAIALQNTMGLVCDPVQGRVEIPCHTRNAAAASNAFLCADLVLGGYQNPIPLDETIDAVLAVGRSMPSELLCTARGGLAATPSAKKLKCKGC